MMMGRLEGTEPRPWPLPSAPSPHREGLHVCLVVYTPRQVNHKQADCLSFLSRQVIGSEQSEVAAVLWTPLLPGGSQKAHLSISIPEKPAFLLVSAAADAPHI